MFNVPNEILLVFHNGSNYDYHFIMKELANEFERQLECLGENIERYRTFSIPIIVTRNNIVWKLARGYCLCYCKTFSLVPGSTKNFLRKCAVHYLYHLKSNNIVSQRKTTNTEK